MFESQLFWVPALNCSVTKFSSAHIGVWETLKQKWRNFFKVIQIYSHKNTIVEHYFFQNLPKTSYYKLIDWWLLFSLNALVFTMTFHTGIAHLCYLAKQEASPELIQNGYRSKSAFPFPTKKSTKVNSCSQMENFRHNHYYKRALKVNLCAKIGFILLVLIFNTIFWVIALREYSLEASNYLWYFTLYRCNFRDVDC